MIAKANVQKRPRRPSDANATMAEAMRKQTDQHSDRSLFFIDKCNIRRLAQTLCQKEGQARLFLLMELNASVWLAPSVLWLIAFWLL